MSYVIRRKGFTIAAAPKKVTVTERIARSKGTAEFWRDVKIIREIGEGTYQEAIHETKFLPKWIKRRVGKLSEAERIFHKGWAELSREARAAKWREGRGMPEGMSEKMREDYEDYWETPE